MDYSSRILNLRLDTRAEVAPMKFGHADARYAAAEIAREAEAEIEELKAKLEIEAATKEEWAARAMNAEAKLLVEYEDCEECDGEGFVFGGGDACGVKLKCDECNGTGLIPDVHEEPEDNE